MRKGLAALVACGLLAGGSLPAAAGKKKKTKTVKETLKVTALPFPNYSSASGTPNPGCSAGQEGVHKMTFPFQTPGAGKLTVTSEDFSGDWDLYVFDGEGVVVGRSEEPQAPPDLAAPKEKIEIALQAGITVDIVACNWLGELQNEFTYTYVYVPSGKAGGGHQHH